MGFLAHPETYIIAEIGSNHDGDLAEAEYLIGQAAHAGANACKFQLFHADRTYPPGADRDAMAKVELPFSWIPLLARAAKAEGLDFICSVFDLASVEELEPFVNAYKIASIEASWRPLVAACAIKPKPLIISTGTMSAEEVSALANWLKREYPWRVGGKDVAVLHCVTAYPAPLQDVNLLAMNRMAMYIGWAAIGISDHSLDPLLVPCAAVALGAQVIEKHLTRDRSRPGPDHSFALNPTEFGQMVAAVRAVELVLGDGIKRAQPSEKPYLALRRGPAGLRGA